jgi:hypothetical protein
VTRNALPEHRLVDELHVLGMKSRNPGADAQLPRDRGWVHDNKECKC